MLLTHLHILVVGLARLTDLVCLAPEIIRVYKIMVSPVVGVDNFVDIYLASQLTSLVIFLQVRTCANVLYVQGERVRLIDLTFTHQDVQFSVCFFVSDAWTGDDICMRSRPYAMPLIGMLFPAPAVLVKYYFFFFYLVY
jgi:hypothetical protein